MVLTDRQLNSKLFDAAFNVYFAQAVLFSIAGVTVSFFNDVCFYFYIYLQAFRNYFRKIAFVTLYWS